MSTSENAENPGKTQCSNPTSVFYGCSHSLSGIGPLSVTGIMHHPLHVLDGLEMEIILLSIVQYLDFSPDIDSKGLGCTLKINSKNTSQFPEELGKFMEKFIKTQVHAFLLANNSQVLLEFNEFSIIFLPLIKMQMSTSNYTSQKHRHSSSHTMSCWLVSEKCTVFVAN